MASYISAMKNHINAVSESINQFYPDVPLRLAFIGYRDHGDGADRLSVFRLSPDLAAFQTFVGSQKAKGGADGPEDVFGALSVATTLEWQAATRILYHIGDAPCHGTSYHSLTDDYPAGDPNGLLAENLIPALIDKDIQYNFGKINSYTDLMIRKFNEIAARKGAPAYITTFQANNASTLMSSVATSVTASMYSSISSSKSVGRDVEEIPVIVDTSEPKWGTIASEVVLVYTLNLSSPSLAELAKEEPKYLNAVPDRASLKVAQRPFNFGSIRAVFKVQSTGSPVVHKVPRNSRSADKVREKFEASYISPHWAATILAINFEAVRPSGFPSLRYTQASLVQYLERTGTPYCTQESLMNGHFEKYNNNSGMVLPNPAPSGANHDVIQAFSHWTCTVTEGEMIVVDCQGVYDNSTNTFLLTDPALHCKDRIRFGNTNLHKVGFKRFFKSHRCNDCCRALGLSVPEEYAAAATATGS
jgi:hypothetical protein